MTLKFFTLTLFHLVGRTRAAAKDDEREQFIISGNENERRPLLLFPGAMRKKRTLFPDVISMARRARNAITSSRARWFHLCPGKLPREETGDDDQHDEQDQVFIDECQHSDFDPVPISVSPEEECILQQREKDDAAITGEENDELRRLAAESSQDESEVNIHAGQGPDFLPSLFENLTTASEAQLADFRARDLTVVRMVCEAPVGRLSTTEQGQEIEMLTRHLHTGSTQEDDVDVEIRAAVDHDDVLLARVVQSDPHAAIYTETVNFYAVIGTAKKTKQSVTDIKETILQAFLSDMPAEDREGQAQMQFVDGRCALVLLNPHGTYF